jgi:hypothetical protein
MTLFFLIMIYIKALVGFDSLVMDTNHRFVMTMIDVQS